MVFSCDLIKTIEDDEEVPDFSEKSDEEDDVSLLRLVILYLFFICIKFKIPLQSNFLPFKYFNLLNSFSLANKRNKRKKTLLLTLNL